MDSLDYINDNSNVKGAIWGRFIGQDSTNKTILNYNIRKLVPNSPIKLIVKYRSVLDPKSDIAKKCDSIGNKTISFKVDINPNSSNTSLEIDAPEIKFGEDGMFVYDKAYADPYGAFSFNVNVPYQNFDNDWSSLEITSIEVYGEASFSIFSNPGKFVCAGDSIKMNLIEYINDVKLQWYSDSIAIPGATQPQYSFVSANDQNYRLSLELKYDSTSIKTDVYNINTLNCGERFKGEGISKKVIFKEDFGEFDLSDKFGHTYRKWDYSDIANPVLVTKKTDASFRYELDESPLGYEFVGKRDVPVNDGQYTVAGVLTGYYHYVPPFLENFNVDSYSSIPSDLLINGARLGWTNQIHGLDSGNKIFIPTDHSGKPEGCCLFVNFDYDSNGKVFFERQVTNLCENSLVSFECYISIFSASGSEPYNPVDVTLRVSEIDNPSNFIEKRATQTLPSKGGTGDWVKISGDFYIENGNSIKIELLSNVDSEYPSPSGNDLTVDDIIISAYEKDLIDPYFNINTLTTDTFTCENSDDNIKIYVKSNYTSANDHRSDDIYIYQWSLSPYDRKSWKRIGEPTKDSVINVGTEPFVGLSNTDRVYFRVITGDSIISTKEDEYFDAVSVCNTGYYVSKSIACTVKKCFCNDSIDKNNRLPQQVLVGGSDFEPMEEFDDKPRIRISDIKMKGLYGGSFIVYNSYGRNDIDNSYGRDDYFITNNPHNLDSLHYIDDKSNDWGFMWKKNSSYSNDDRKMEYSVTGLIPYTPVKLVVQYRSVFNPECTDTSIISDSVSNQKLSFEIALNPYNEKLFQSVDVPEFLIGERSEFFTDNTTSDSLGIFSFRLVIPSKYLDNNYSSIEITSVKVYGYINDPIVKSNNGDFICVGDSVTITTSRNYGDVKYQWYNDSIAISGATNQTYSFESDNEQIYKFKVKVSYDSTSFFSDLKNISSMECKNIVFRNDFGEFDLTDTTGLTYKVWDYSDIANPVQTTKKTLIPFRYELDSLDAPIEHKFCKNNGLFSGEYTVAGMLSKANLAWSGDLHGIVLDSGFHVDHSGKPEGCCLFVACKNNDIIFYRQEIHNLCAERRYFFNCYISMCSYNSRIDVTTRVYEIGNPENKIDIRHARNSQQMDDTRDWIKFSGGLFLEKGNSIGIEFINTNPTTYYNDVVIDDITLFSVPEPQLEASINKDLASLENKEMVIVADSEFSLTDYFGQNVRYSYQWTLNPNDIDSWKTIDDPIKESNKNVDVESYSSLSPDEKVYFRVMASDNNTLSSIIEGTEISNDYCKSSFSVSNIIEVDNSKTEVPLNKNLETEPNAIVNVYSASGSLIKFNVKRSEALSGLEDGVYLVGGEKVVVKK